MIEIHFLECNLMFLLTFGYLHLQAKQQGNLYVNYSVSEEGGKSPNAA